MYSLAYKSSGERRKVDPDPLPVESVSRYTSRSTSAERVQHYVIDFLKKMDSSLSKARSDVMVDHSTLAAVQMSEWIPIPPNL